MTAATILNFGQNGVGQTVSAIVNANNTTTIKASQISINITSILNGSPTNAYFNFSATSTGSVSGFPLLQQPYSGKFSITANADGTGENYLSGVFDGMSVGIDGTGSAFVSSASPAYSLTYTSDIITMLGSPNAMSLSFVNVVPGFTSCGGTLCNFTASVTGNFSASPVPEPAEWAMMVVGFGLLGATMRRRRATVAVHFA